MLDFKPCFYIMLSFYAKMHDFNFTVTLLDSHKIRYNLKKNQKPGNPSPAYYTNLIKMQYLTCRNNNWSNNV